MNKPELEVHSALNIWAGVEYKGSYLKAGQQFVTLEDYLATLDWVENRLKEKLGGNDE